MKLNFLRYAIAALFIIGTTASAWAQLTLVTSPYTQNFDTIGSGLPRGWTVRTGSTASALGTTESLATGSIDWGSTTGRFGNSAAAESPAASTDNTSTQSGRTDRAVSLKQSGSFGDPGAAWVLGLDSTKGQSSFNLSFKFQQLQPVSSGRTVTFIVDYGIGNSPSSFTSVTTSPATIQASLATGGPGWSSVNVSAALPSAIDNQSQKVWIRIVTIAGSTGSGTRPMVAIDDVSLSWSGGSCIPGTPTSSDVSACVGSSATITGAGPTTGANYTYWTASTGGSAITTSTTPPGTVSGNNLTTPTTLTAGTYTYYVQADAGASCVQTTRKAVTVTISAPPATPTTADASTCQGSTTTITGAGSGTGATYTFWTAATGGTQITSGTTPPGTVSGATLTVPSSLAAGTYHYYVEGAIGTCTSTSRKDVTVTVNALPANPGNPVPAANPACTSTTLGIMTPAAGTTNYWQGTSSSGTNTANTTASTYSVSSNGTYYVRARNNTTLCWSATSGSVAVVVNTAPSTPGTISQSPGGTVCTGSNYVYTVTNTSGVTYNWSFPSTWTIVGAATGNSVTVTAGTSIGTISVTGSNNCGTSGPRNFTVSGIGTAATFTTQPTSASACDNSSIVLSGTATGASSYQWEYSGDGENFSTLYSGSYGVTLSNTNTVTIAYPVMNDWYGYYFRLKANSSTCGPRYSDTIQILGNAPTVTVPPTATTIATYNFGTASSGLPSGWTTYAVPTSTGTLWEQANSSPSSGYTGASGNSNLMIGQNSSGGAGRRAYVETPAISTVGKGNISVIWAVRMTGSFIGDLRLEYSVDNGGQWTDLPYTFASNTTTTVAWRLENYGIEIQLPTNANNISNLKLRWSSILQSTNSNLRIDDIKISGSDISTPAVDVCGGSTFNIPYLLPDLDADQYTLSVSPAITGFTPVVNATLPATQIPVTIPAGTPTGDYTFTLSVKDATSGCSSVEQVYMVHVTTPTFTYTKTDIQCYGLSAGGVVITPTSGAAPYLYTVSNFVSTQTLGTYVTLGAGSLNIGIEDANGCRSAVVAVNITQPTAPVTVSAGNGGPYTVGQTINLTSSASGGTGTITYAWSGPGSYTANTANPSRANAQTTHTGTYAVTATDANGCTATASTAVTVNPAASNAYVWTGNVDTEWDTPGNWDVNQVPNNCLHNVTIPSNPPSGNYPAIDVVVSVGNINLGNGARITLNDNLNVCGNWAGGASTSAILLGTGAVVLQGSATQTVSGKTQFNTLQANNTAGVQVQGGSAVEIFTALELKAGNFNAGNNLVTFRSVSTTEVGIIDNFSAGFNGTLSGTIKAQRYYESPSANSFNQHMMGSPVDAPSVAQFGASGVAGTVVPVNCAMDVFANNSPYGTVYNYNEPNGATCGVQAWESVTSGNMTNGKGYSVARNGTGTLTVSGTANLNSTYTVSGLGNSNYSNTASYVQTPPFTTVTVGSGWHLVANPYLANLNITTHAANSAFDAQIQVWEGTGPFAGTYRPRMTGSNANLAPFQAFMIHKTAVGGSASYNLYASDRSLNTASFYRQANQSELRLVAENLTTGLLDETFVAFNSDATAQFDPIYDANKMQGTNTRHTLYSVLGNTDYAINTLNDVQQTATVPVSMRPGADASFRFSVDGINSFDPTQYIYLEDKVTGQMIDLRQNPEYTFSMTTAEAFDRFVLHFTPAATMQANNATCEAQGTIALAQPGAASWNYTVTDANSATISSGTLNEANPVTVHAATGVYTVTLVDANNYTVTREVTVSGTNAADGTFNASATTVEEGSDVAFTANQAGATYTWNLGNGATATGSGVTMAYLTPGVYTVELTVTTAGGCTATSTQLVTVTEKVATGIKDVTEAGIKLWSNTNKVYVDFGKVKQNNASVSIYNLIGQELAKDAVNGTLYVREVSQIEAGYVLVRVENNGAITTKKLLITNK